MHVVGRTSELALGAGRLAGHSEGYRRQVLVDRTTGSPHQEVVIAHLEPGGGVDRHLHAFEKALYVLSGRVVLEVAGQTEHLTADDYVFIDRAVPHAFANDGSDPARWLEVCAPQPGAGLDDTVFVAVDAPGADVETPYRRWHFDESALPAPSSAIGLAGFGEANVGGAAAKVLIGPDTGASQLILMVVQYAPGGFITRHDHAFEEAFFFLTGEIEASLDEERHTLVAGDFCWSGVGSMQALANRSNEPVRWLETQVPQPPSRYQARFVADWERLVGETAASR